MRSDTRAEGSDEAVLVWNGMITSVPQRSAPKTDEAGPATLRAGPGPDRHDPGDDVPRHDVVEPPRGRPEGDPQYPQYRQPIG